MCCLPSLCSFHSFLHHVKNSAKFWMSPLKFPQYDKGYRRYILESTAGSDRIGSCVLYLCMPKDDNNVTRNFKEQKVLQKQLLTALSKWVLIQYELTQQLLKQTRDEQLRLDLLISRELRYRIKPLMKQEQLQRNGSIYLSMVTLK